MLSRHPINAHRQAHGRWKRCVRQLLDESNASTENLSFFLLEHAIFAGAHFVALTKNLLGCRSMARRSKLNPISRRPSHANGLVPAGVN